MSSAPQKAFSLDPSQCLAMEAPDFEGNHIQDGL